MTTEQLSAFYAAFAAGDRDAVDGYLADDFTFSSPDDPYLDKAGFFERCFANHEHITGFEIERVFAREDEVVVRYLATRSDGTRFRNLELLRVGDGQVHAAQVYYGATLT